MLEEDYISITSTGETGEDKTPYGCYIRGLQMEIRGQMRDAIILYENAAKRNYFFAISKLGDVYFDGTRGVEVDEDKALKYYESFLSRTAGVGEQDVLNERSRVERIIKKKKDPSAEANLLSVSRLKKDKKLDIGAESNV